MYKWDKFMFHGYDYTISKTKYGYTGFYSSEYIWRDRSLNKLKKILSKDAIHRMRRFLNKRNN